MTRTFERRVFPVADAKILRADDRTGTLKFRGRPWVYGQMSDDMGGWQEIIEAGAATRTLATNPDVRFLVNHDANLLLARTASGTLQLAEDDEGGIAEADMANVSYARDLAELIDRGDLTQMSFGFWITSDDWSGNLHRVREFDLDGGDVSAVTFPAFPQTSSELRSAAKRVVGDSFVDIAEKIAEAPIIDLTCEGLTAFVESLAMERDSDLAPLTLVEGTSPDSIRSAIETLRGLIEEPADTFPLERAQYRLREIEALNTL